MIEFLHSHIGSIVQLALKHRPHKNHAPRIILFVASPIKEDEAKLKKLGTQLQKNEVAVDIINFGEEQENTSKLEAFFAAVNKNDNRHCTNHFSVSLTDELWSSAI